MSKAKLFFLYLLFISLSVFSQNNSPTKITVFKPEDTAPVTKRDTFIIQDRNNIKWNYSLLLRGIFLLNYEFFINQKITGEVGFGLTFRDFIFETIHGYENIASETSTVNFAVEGGIRFYPRDFSNFEGLYISPIVSYRKYSFDTSSSHNASAINQKGSFTPGYTFLDLQFKIGYQYESFWLDELMGEVYLGFALRNATLHYYDQKNRITSKLKIPQALFGLKVGIPF